MLALDPLNGHKQSRTAAGLVALLAALAVLGTVSGHLIYVGLPSAALAFSVVPYALRAVQLYEPWSLLVLNLFISVALPGAAIALQFPDADAVQALVRGTNATDFFWPTSVLVLSVVTMTFGYFAGAHKTRPSKIKFLDAPWNRRTLVAVVVVLLAVSLVGTVAFIAQTGGLNLQELSAKRTPFIGERISSYESYGALRWLAGLGGIAFLAVWSYHITKLERIRWPTWAALAALFGIATLLPFYASSRSGIIILALQAVALWFYARRPLGLGKAVLLGLSVLLVFQLMSSLRSSVYLDEPISVAPSQGLRTLILSRNGIGLEKTQTIINAVGDELSYEFGGTIVPWLVAPVPRALWESKPIVQAGPEIGITLYGTRGSGVPPGLVAELYWNFGILGVAIGSALLLAVVGALSRSIAPARRWSSGRALVFASAVFAPTWSLLSNGIGPWLFESSMAGVLTIGFLVVVTRRPTHPVGALNNAVPGSAIKLWAGSSQESS